MDYNSLIGPKGTAGSIANWVNYSKLDIPTVVDEAQTLLWTILRVRQMRSEWTFGMSVGQSQIALPDRFLDPIGRLFDTTNNTSYGHNIETDIAELRCYDTAFSGTLAANPFTTTAGSALVTVHETAHGLTQGSTAFYAGANTSNGLTLNGGYPVIQIIDADNYLIDAGTEASASGASGGATIAYIASQLIPGQPMHWSVWDEQVKFDLAFNLNVTLKMLYYRAPAPLSTANPTNWLTKRYPNLMRSACQAAAASFMKDDNEYQKNLTALTALYGSIAKADDLAYRGAEFGTDTP